MSTGYNTKSRVTLRQHASAPNTKPHPPAALVANQLELRRKEESRSEKASARKWRRWLELTCTILLPLITWWAKGQEKSECQQSGGAKSWKQNETYHHANEAGASTALFNSVTQHNVHELVISTQSTSNLSVLVQVQRNFLVQIRPAWFVQKLNKFDEIKCGFGSLCGFQRYLRLGPLDPMFVLMSLEVWYAFTNWSNRFERWGQGAKCWGECTTEIGVYCVVYTT